jgi:hypothetical protein
MNNTSAAEVIIQALWPWSADALDATLGIVGALGFAVVDVRFHVSEASRQIGGDGAAQEPPREPLSRAAGAAAAGAAAAGAAAAALLLAVHRPKKAAW